MIVRPDMLAIIPAAGRGSRIQPLAFSKELLPLGSRSIDGAERPRAISEHLLDRMVDAGATRICFVIAPEKMDIIQYYGDQYRGIPVFYIIQPRAQGLCDALFRATPHLSDAESVLIGLPDTIWYPANGLRELPDIDLALLLFPVDQPSLFDAVQLDSRGRVISIAVKDMNASTPWIWGAMRFSVSTFCNLAHLWRQRKCQDEYLGTLLNAWIRNGGEALGFRLGQSYCDVGTLHGWRGALEMIDRLNASPAPAEALP